MRIISVLVFVVALLAAALPTAAQATPVACGDIVEGEFTAPAQRFDYRIELAPGDSMMVNGEVIGTSLGFMIALENPAGEGLLTSITEGGNTRPEPAPSVFSDIVSARGAYNLIAYNDRVFKSVGSDLQYQTGRNEIGSVGIFRMKISCTLRDGTVIEAGQSAAAAAASTTTSSQPVGIAVPAFGFPGLAPVDFANAFRLPLVLGTTAAGEIPAGGDQVLGFRFNGEAGQVIDLSFVRTYGNLNLGMVVISADNQIAYAAALVTSDAMSTRFSVPADGEYTIGFFRLDLIPPASPSATGFEISANSN